MLEPTNDCEEPAPEEHRTKNKKLTFKAGNNRSGLKGFKEFYVASQCYSIHFLKTRLVLACASGFEVVDPKTLDVQALLDPADLSLTFLKPLRDLRPIAIYRTESDFLLCYTHCAFHVDKGGWKLEDSPVMEWSGVSNSFAFDWPYLVICMSRHAEIRDVRDGKAIQVIQGDNFRRVFENNEPSKRSSGTLPKEGSPVVMVSDSQVMLVRRGLPPRGLEAKARQGASTSSDT